MTQKFQALSRGFLAALTTFAATTASADNADIDIPGPTGRSYLVVSGAYGRFTSDTEWPVGTPYVSLESSHRAGWLRGSLALHERIDVTVSAGRSIGRNRFNYVSNPPTTISGAANSYGVGLTVRPIGSATRPGFGLVLSAHANHSEGSSTDRSWSIQPLYRFTPSFVGGINWQRTRYADHYRSDSVDASLVWKVTPDMSVIPTIGRSRSNPQDGTPSIRTTSVGIGVTHHFDRHLSASGGAFLDRTDAYSDGISRTINSRGTTVFMGLRWTF